MRFSVGVVVLFVVGCVGPFEDPSVRAARQALGPDTGTPFELDASVYSCDNNGDCSGGMDCIGHVCLPAVDGGFPDSGVATGSDGGAPIGGGTGSSIGGGGGSATGGGYVGGGVGASSGGGGGYVGGGGGSSTGGGYVGGGSATGGGFVGGGTGTGTGGGLATMGGGTGTSTTLNCSTSSSNSSVTCTGEDGAHLGWSVSLCNQKVFVAGAPGVQGLFRFNNGTKVWKQVTNAPDIVGTTALCKTATVAYVGGPGGIYKLNEVDLFETLWPYATSALGELYEGPAEFTQLAASETSSGETALLRMTTGGFAIGWHDSSVINPAIATSPDGTTPLVVIGSHGGNSDAVTVLQRASNGLDFEYYSSTDRLNTTPLAGVSVAIGNVWPDDDGGSENEVLVATQFAVYLFRGDLSYITKIPFTSAVSAHTGLPAVIVVDDGLLATNSRLHPFWLGLPGSNQVMRCLGTRCLPWQTGEAGSEYGASIDVKNNAVLVGAPFEQNGRGAVHLYPRQVPDLNGEDQACDDQMPCCTAAGYSGTCTGGVLCQIDTSTMPPPLCGENDGGVLDGGQEDGGKIVSDGGTRDGGGEVTPGDLDPASFAARGCNAAPGALGLVLALLALRRAKRAS